MKRNLFIAALLVMTSSFATAEVKQFKYDVSAFTGIDISNSLEVSLERGDNYLVEVETDELLKEYVSVSVKGGTLFVTFDEKTVPADVKKQMKAKGTPATSTKVSITMPGISSINLADKSQLESLSTFTTDGAFILTCTDNAIIKALTVESPSAVISIDKKSNVTANIKSESITTTSSGSASLALTQETRNSSVKVSGVTSVVLCGNCGHIDLSSKGNAKVILNGNCDDMDYNLVGGCDVNALNLVNPKAKVKMNGSGTLTTATTDVITLNLSSGSTLVFNNKPLIDIVSIKNASVKRYGDN